MKTYFIGLLIAFYLISTHTYACLQGYGINIYGQETHFVNLMIYSYKVDLKNLKPRLAHIEKHLQKEYRRKEKTQEYWINLSALRLYQGRSREAKEILLKVLPQDSLSYELHSNLGVAYELQGDLEKAYYHTKKGLIINKRSHMGTEWLHLKILEAAMQQKKDSKWVYSHGVLDLYFGTDSLPDKKALLKFGKSFPYGSYIKSIEYQLKERLIFVKPTDLIVGNLILTLADLLSLSTEYGKVKEIYKLAKVYDPALKMICNKRIAYINKLLQKSGKKEDERFEDVHVEVISNTALNRYSYRKDDEFIDNYTPYFSKSEAEKPTRSALMKTKSDGKSAFVWMFLILITSFLAALFIGIRKGGYF